MNHPAIRVENLSKLYRLGNTHCGSLREVIQRRASRLLGRKRELLPHEEAAAARLARDGEFWALRDVSFEVRPGEVVGIVGRNGAGKSTLLKILSRITSPTHGQVAIRGRVASLLEVGTGFHPELTGRENVYLNGAILGMTKSEIRRKFDEIVDFAGVAPFIDTPVKRYSSGMMVRLGFAVAAHLDPEIIIVDEVLAVGDMEFQAKCLGQMRAVARSGRTVLFVSHQLSAIRELTQRSVVLHLGRTIFQGPTEIALREYIGKRTAPDGNLQNHPRCFANMPRSIEFTHATSMSGQALLRFNEPICFCLTLRSRSRLWPCTIGITVLRADGLPIGSFVAKHIRPAHDSPECRVILGLTDPRLAPGSYVCRLCICDDSPYPHETYDALDHVLAFAVAASPDLPRWNDSAGGVYWPPQQVHTRIEAIQ